MKNDENVIRRALILSSSVSALIALVIIISVILLGGKEEEIQVDEAEVTGPRPRAVAVAPTILLTDITAQSGIEFFHTNGAYGSRMLPETMGGGVAFFDYNNDTHQDLLLINSSCVPISEIRPPFKTTIQSAFWTVDKRWAIIMTVRSSKWDRMLSMTVRSVSLSSADVASSNTRTEAC